VPVVNKRCVTHFISCSFMNCSHPVDLTPVASFDYAGMSNRLYRPRPDQNGILGRSQEKKLSTTKDEDERVRRVRESISRRERQN